MKAWIGTAVVAIVGLTLVVPAADAAKPRHYKIPGAHTMEFSLRGSNGYAITVAATGRRTEVIAKKGNAWIYYMPRGGGVVNDGIETKLPGIGWISVEFRPLGKPRRIPLSSDCTGRPSEVQKGIFVGTFRLRGERGYTSVVSDRARGSASRTFPADCRESSGERSHGSLHYTLLSATERRGRTAIQFGATQFDFGFQPISAPDPVVFSASAITLRRSMPVFRSVSAIAEKGAGLSIPNLAALDSAVVDPPGPFAGSATYGLDPKGHSSWTGSLSAELPGMGTVSLAGPRFKAGLCIDQRCTGDDSLSSSATSIAVGRRR